MQCAPVRQRLGVIRAAAEDPDAELEKRLESLRKVKGATPYGQGANAKRKQPETAAPAKSSAGSKSGTPQVTYDYSSEELHWEGPPHRGDLALNMALGVTLLWLPLTAAAIGRQAFVKYRFTNRRLSVQSTAPWRTEQTDVAYQEIKEVVTISRALGAWGDMIITLNNNDKVELRSIGNFKELKDYMLAQRDLLRPAGAPVSESSRAPGAMVTAAELMGEPEPVKGKKGF